MMLTVFDCSLHLTNHHSTDYYSQTLKAFGARVSEKGYFCTLKEEIPLLTFVYHSLSSFDDEAIDSIFFVFSVMCFVSRSLVQPRWL